MLYAKPLKCNVCMETIKTDIVVLGAGPGGYAAAFYAAERGKKVLLIERDKRLGGVCLNSGCIPSKALLHATKIIADAKESANRGITFSPPAINLDAMRHWKDSILERLGGGIKTSAEKRKVEILYGEGRFENSREIRLQTSAGEKSVQFEKAIIAVGSRAAMPKAFGVVDKRVMTSTEALALEEIPKDLLVIGGGYIGMELGTVYAALGSSVVVVEAMESILTGVDADLVRPVMRSAQKKFREIRLSTKVMKLASSGKRIGVTLEQNGQQKEESYDRVLVAVGRVANSEALGLENTKAVKDEKGFIKVDSTQRTPDPAIYAIGDIAGGVMLAHKASKEARIAVDYILGKTAAPEKFVLPAVVFTDPEIAWCGLGEEEARQKGIPVEISRFLWSASGRAVSMDRPDGVTKLIIEPKTERILGVGIAGVGAGELISEGVVAVQKGLTSKELANCVHPHPTLSETLMESAEAFYGLATHALSRKKS